MPALLTHYCFASEVLKEEATEAALVGGQGPDVFFFYGMLPWRKREVKGVVDAFGRRLHKIDPADFYPLLFKYASTSEDKEILSSYLDGLLLHYCMDRACHPYIFYKSGKSYDPKLSRLYSLSHMYFETLLDVIFRKRHKLKLRPDLTLKLGEKEATAISKMWAAAAKESDLVDELPEDCFSGGVQDYKGLERFIVSKSGFKRFLIKLVFKKESEPWIMSYPRNLGKCKDIDFLNEKKEPWLDPVTGEERDSSFLDLWNQAALDFKAFRALKDKALEGKDVKEEMAKLTRGLNHDGAHDGDIKSHFGLVWEVEKP